MHLVGFIIRIYQNAWSPERQIKKKCLNVGGSCVEKLLRVCNNDTLNLFLLLSCLFFFITKWSVLSG